MVAAVLAVPDSANFKPFVDHALGHPSRNCLSAAAATPCAGRRTAEIFPSNFSSSLQLLLNDVRAAPDLLVLP